jgi:hypothetical protein
MLKTTEIESVSHECFKCYHTQEWRGDTLESPIICNDKKAWLGVGYYFWFEEQFAKYWGEDFKCERTGFYDVYNCYVEDNQLLNMCFCEEDYFFVRNNLNKLIEKTLSLNENLNLKQIHRLFRKNFLDKMGINGIVYDDLPNNSFKKDRTYSLIPPFYYVKRIQVVVFNKDIIHNFELYFEEQS